MTHVYLVVVYKHVMLQHQMKYIVGERCVPSLIVESKVSLITTCCLRLFVVVYKVEML